MTSFPVDPPDRSGLPRRGRTQELNDMEFRDRLVRAGVPLVKPTRTLRGEAQKPNFAGIVSGEVQFDLRDIRRSLFYTVLTEDVDVLVPLGCYAGARFMWMAQQDGTGGHNVNNGASVIVGAGESLTPPSTSANYVTLYEGVGLTISVCYMRFVSRWASPGGTVYTP